MASIKELQDQFNEALSRLELPSNPSDLYVPISYTLANGGKRMRPLLVLMGCKIFSDSVEQALHPALAVELFHNFTLLHDDIMDDAPLRRGKPTVHEKWNPNVAILSGDVTLVTSYQELVKTRPEAIPQVLQIFSSTAAQICEGQQLDMNFEEQDDVTIDEYLHMIKLKTAVLLGASLQIGAIIGGASPENARLLYDFGLNAGIAFQLQDDILDVYGESHKVGKQKGGDIISNKKTFLLLKAMELAENESSVELNSWLDSNDDTNKVEAVTSIYQSLGVRELAEERMWSYYNQGIASLEKVNGNEEWKSLLKGFAHNLMQRES